MQLRWSALFAVALCFGVGACEELASSQSNASASSPVAAPATNVLLVANLGEADEPCVCGKMIRSVRAAASHGVKVREVDMRNEAEEAKVARGYRILVAPTVLFLDDTGKEVSRFEGESKETFDGVQATLDGIAKRN